MDFSFPGNRYIQKWLDTIHMKRFAAGGQFQERVIYRLFGLIWGAYCFLEVIQVGLFSHGLPNSALIWLYGSGAILFPLNALLLKWVSLRKMNLLLISQAAIFLALIAWFSGGFYHSSALYWLLVYPFMAGILMGFRVALTISLLAIFLLILLYAPGMLLNIPVSGIVPEQAAPQRFWGALGSMVFTLFCHWVYERKTRRSQRQQNKLHQNLEKEILERTIELTRVNQKLRREIQTGEVMRLNLLIYEETVNHMSIGATIWNYSDTGDYTQAMLQVMNPAASRILGLEMVPGETRIKEVFPLVNEEGNRERLLQIFLNHDIFSITEYGVAGTQTELFLDIKIFALTENRYAVLFEDVTERHTVALKLASQTRDLEESNADLRQFAYVASHDLQEPLRMVSSFMGLLQRKHSAHLNDEAREYIQFATQGAKRMTLLITDLLMFSRLGSNALEKQMIDPAIVVNEVLKYLKQRIQETGAQVVLQPMKEVWADPPRLYNLFQNLIGNGIKFCRHESPVIEVGTMEREDGVAVYVRDNGIGIEEIYLEKIFAMFQRLHSQEKYEGTGIGLAICRKIMEQHRGRIWVESAVGKGSTFYCLFPPYSEDAVP